VRCHSKSRGVTRYVAKYPSSWTNRIIATVNTPLVKGVEPLLLPFMIR
jgi:hypothetical protein